MSQENVAIARGLLTRWERGDYYTAEAFDPEVEFTRTGGGADVLGFATESRGIDGLWAALGAWTEEWSDVRVQAESFMRVGERVLVLVRHRAVGKSSGVPMNHLDAWAFSFRDGRVVRWDAYWNPADAKRALGIKE
jgi:ketosteroid isomerase-like protein